MFLRRNLLPFAGQLFQGADHAEPGVARLDDVVDVALLGRLVRVAEEFVVFRLLLRLDLGPLGRVFDGLEVLGVQHVHRTVANIRSYFTKCGGTLGTSGSVSFMFDHKCVFRIKEDPEKPVDLEELELELIDFGAEEVFEEENEQEDGEVTKEIVIYGAFESYGQIQKYIEDNNYELVSGDFEWLPNVELKEVTPEQRETLDKLTGMIEDDDDVTNVYSTMKPSAE